MEEMGSVASEIIKARICSGREGITQRVARQYIVLTRRMGIGVRINGKMGRGVAAVGHGDAHISAAAIAAGNGIGFVWPWPEQIRPARLD